MSELYKYIIKYPLLLGLSLFFISMVNGQQISVRPNLTTGALSEIKITPDSTGMDWIMSTDGLQYKWIDEKYGWGLGFFDVSRNNVTTHHHWQNPQKISSDGMEAQYDAGGIIVNVKREMLPDGKILETFIFENPGHEVVSIQDLGIFTPFNDNYPDSKTCIKSRTNAHIWAGGNGAWVNAIRMGGEAPHLGLALAEGEIAGYEIFERGLNKGNSQYRGVIALKSSDFWLSPGQSHIIQWILFPHQGNDDFCENLKALGGVVISADKYVGEVGDTLNLIVRGNIDMNRFNAQANGVKIQATISEDMCNIPIPINQPGEIDVAINFAAGKYTHANLLGISSEKRLIDSRCAFILNRQQMEDPSDPRYGAFMVYDLEGDSIYLNDKPNCNPVDRDEGAERLGMGVLLAKRYRLSGDSVTGNAVTRYADFVRYKLQNPDYKTFSSVDKTKRNRGYNYMWVADLYFQLYLATGERKYAEDGYGTLMSMFDQFGHNFYAIGIPVLSSIKALEKAGMSKECESLIKEYEKVGANMIANGVEYPASEVNYEQAIVAPAIQFLEEMYLATKEKQYLDEVERQLPVLMAFNGIQPSFHLNDIALRHWDGYWFGKREMFGDTMPHYWSSSTGVVLYYYYKITGDESYLQRARNIIRNNLCLFFEDGRASCAYIYPDKIDGAKGAFYDPFSNDQDWALVHYYTVNYDLN